MRTYPTAANLLQKADLDLDTADLRVALLMENTTANSEDAATVDGFTTLDEMDGSGYARKTLTGGTVTLDAVNRWSEFDADDVSFPSLGVGTRGVAGILLYEHVTDDSDSIPLAFIDGGDFPYEAIGATLTVVWGDNGLLQIRAV